MRAARRRAGECPPMYLADFVDRGSIDALEQAWEAMETQVSRAGGTLQLQSQPG